MTANSKSTRGVRRPDQAGQALAEYALVISLVSMICVASLTAIGANANMVLQTMADALIP
jgi:Flp pilus assembly pilin Flp